MEWQDKFFNDPEWHKVEDVFIRHITPLRDVMSIDTKGATRDEVFAEVLARQKNITMLYGLMQEKKMTQRQISDPVSYE